MSVTLAPAKVGKTIIYAGETHHPGRRDIHSLLYTHVLGIQNRAENLGDRPNALIIPFPSKAPMGPENIIDTTANPDILIDMAKTIRGMDRTRLINSVPRGYPSPKTFTSGSYTVAMAQNASQIVQAIASLPESLRPVLNREIVNTYAQWYPDWPVAVCAWDGRIEAEPLFWWYEPMDPKVLFMPALDATKGKTPNPRADVVRDHTLIIGSTINPFGLTNPSTDLLGGFISPQVWGQVVWDKDFNGDYVVGVEQLRQLKNYQGRHDLHERLDPKIWEVDFENYNPASP